MWIDEEVNQNDENLGNVAEKLQKLLEKVPLLQKKKKKKKKGRSFFVIPPGLSLSKDSVLNDILRFIFIFTF